VFHWPLSEIEALPLPEFFAWHAAASEFLERQAGPRG